MRDVNLLINPTDMLEVIGNEPGTLYVNGMGAKPNVPITRRPVHRCKHLRARGRGFVLHIRCSVAAPHKPIDRNC